MGGGWLRRRTLASAAGAALGLLLGSLFATYAMREASLAGVVEGLARLGGWEAAAILAANLAVSGAMCIRWRIMIERLGDKVPMGRLVLYRTAANGVAMVTPGPQFGGEPLQVHLLGRFHGIPAAAASASVAMDRLVEMAATFLVLGGAGLSFVHRGIIHGGALWSMLPLAAVLSAVLWWGVKAAGRSGTPLESADLGRTGRHCRHRWRTILAAFEGEALRLLRQPPGVLFAYGASALLHWTCILGEFWLVYRCLGLYLNPFEALALAVAARVAFLLPIPAGLGALEGAQVFMVGSLGHDVSTALAACCVFRTRDLLFTGFGLGLAFHWLTPWSFRKWVPMPAEPPKADPFSPPPEEVAGPEA